MNTDDSGDGGKLALILWRLRQLEEYHEAQAKFRRTVWAGIAVALALPLVQLALFILRMTEGG